MNAKEHVDAVEGIEAIYPLSPMQQGMVFHGLHAPESKFYFMQFQYDLTGELNTEAFESAWQEVARRHAILRTAFDWQDFDNILQVVFREVTLPVTHLDWRRLAAQEQQRKLLQWLTDDIKSGLDLGRAPLMRLALIRLEDRRYRFVWSWHHALLDAWSSNLLLQETAGIYQQVCNGEPHHGIESRPFRDYIDWLEQQDRGESDAFWRSTLDDFCHPTALAWIRRDASSGSYDGAEYGTKLDIELTNSLKNIARVHQFTLNTVVQGAWGILLSRHTGSEDVVFGATVSGRPAGLRGIETMVGLFINTLPVRVQVRAHQSVASYLALVHRTLNEIQQYAHTPLVDIQTSTTIPQGVPLFETYIVFQNYPGNVLDRESSTDEPARNSHPAVTMQAIASRTAVNYPLALLVAPAQALRLKLLFDRARVSEKDATRLIGHLTAILRQIARDQNQWVGRIGLMEEDDSVRLVRNWSGASVHTAPDASVTEMIEAQCRRTPGAWAVASGPVRLTYGDLQQRTERLAGYLRACGVGPEVPVAVLLPRGVDMILALLAVMKSGGAYVPIDPETPPERTASILDSAGAPIVLTLQSCADAVRSPWTQIVCMDQEMDERADHATSAFTFPRLDSAAYVIYTSGSTGKPKGVVVEHRQLASYVSSISKHLMLQPGQDVALVSTFAADLGNTVLFPTVCSGATLHVPGAEVTTDSHLFAGFIKQNRIACMKIAPSHLTALLAGRDPEHVLPERLLVLGGEPLRLDLLAHIHELRPKLRVLNHYGPTECTVGAITGIAEASLADRRRRTSPLGRALEHAQTYVLDQAGNPVPDDVPAELFIGGAGVSRGYLGQAAETADRFRPDPFSTRAGGRIYRTGDLVRWLDDGQLDFVGRADQQVKIRGYRVELAEIEHAIERYAPVQQCAVAWREAATDARRLVAFIVIRPGAAYSETELRAHVAQWLSNYMIPDAFVVLEALPFTVNGKLDRNALADIRPDSAAVSHASAHPRDGLEFRLRQIWEEVLGLSSVGIRDNFFQIGGHSLTAVTVCARLSRTFDSSISVRSIFDHPTIAELAAHLRQSDYEVRSCVVPVQPRGSLTPLFCVHPASGAVHVYVELAKSLSEEQPVYGIQALGLEPGHDPQLTVEQMAATYVHEIREIQPEGPYQLAGYSLGGVIAYEMAQQLAASGDQVALLALLDSFPIFEPDDEPISDELLRDRERDHLTAVLSELLASPAELSGLDFEQQLQIYVQKSQESGALLGDLTCEEHRRLLRTHVCNQQAVRRYRMAPYSGAVTLFHNSLADDIDADSWSELAQGGLDRVNFSTNHADFLKPPNSGLVAMALMTRLERPFFPA